MAHVRPGVVCHLIGDFLLVSITLAVAFCRIQGRNRIHGWLGLRQHVGGVAHKPWRAPEAERILAGAPPEEPVFRRAAEAAMQGAWGYEHNTFKIELARRAILRALTLAAGGGRTS